jgi:hypothetical protein
LLRSHSVNISQSLDNGVRVNGLPRATWSGALVTRSLFVPLMSSRKVSIFYSYSTKVVGHNLSLRVIQDVRLCMRSSAEFQSFDARVNALSGVPHSVLPLMALMLSFLFGF